MDIAASYAQINEFQHGGDLQQLFVGDRVRMQNLTNYPELNGQCGWVDDFDAPSNCYLVALDEVDIWVESACLIDLRY